MKTSNPKEQFLTAMKNGKIGVFRPQTSIGDIEQLCGGPNDLHRVDLYRSYVIIDNIQVYFYDESMKTTSGMKIDLTWRDDISSLYHRFDLYWLEWFSGLNYDKILQTFLGSSLPFRVLKYTDGSIGVLNAVKFSKILILFTKNGALDSLRLDFEKWSDIEMLKELHSFNI